MPQSPLIAPKRPIAAARSLLDYVSVPHHALATAAQMQTDFVARLNWLARQTKAPVRVYDENGNCTNLKRTAGFLIDSLVRVATEVHKLNEWEGDPELYGWVWVLIYWVGLNPEQLARAILNETATSPLGSPPTRYEKYLICNPADSYGEQRPTKPAKPKAHRLR